MLSPDPEMLMAAAGALFSVDPITSFIIEDVPQVSLVPRRSLALPGWRIGGVAAPMEWAPSPPPLLELLFEP